MELLLFVISPVINALWDAKNNETNHFRSWVIRGLSLTILAIVLALIIPNKYPEIVDSMWWLYALIGFSIEWLLFDNLYNLFKGHKWNYIGEEKYHKDDFTWKIYNKLGMGIILFLKFMFFMTMLSLYLQLDLL